MYIYIYMILCRMKVMNYEELPTYSIIYIDFFNDVMICRIPRGFLLELQQGFSSNECVSNHLKYPKTTYFFR